MGKASKIKISKQMSKTQPLDRPIEEHRFAKPSTRVQKRVGQDEEEEQAVPRSEGSPQMKEELRTWIYGLLAGHTTLSRQSTNDRQTSVPGHTISITPEDLLRAQASCLSNLPPLQLHMNFMQWADRLLTLFIAEILKPYISDTTTVPQHDGENVLHQDGTCSPPSKNLSFSSSSVDANREDISSPWTTVKTEPCEMEEGVDVDSKERILDEDTRQYSTQQQEPPIHDYNDTSTDNRGISVASSQEHKFHLTKDELAVFDDWVRGVRCPICYACFRGQERITEGEEHIKRQHNNSPGVIGRFRRDSTQAKVIGNCGCQSCLESDKLEGYLGET